MQVVYHDDRPECPIDSALGPHEKKKETETSHQSRSGSARRPGVRRQNGITPQRARVLEKEEEHKVDIRWRRSSGGEDVSGEAIAAEEKVSARPRSIRKGMKERMVVAVIATEEE